MNVEALLKIKYSPLLSVRASVRIWAFSLKYVQRVLCIKATITDKTWKAEQRIYNLQINLKLQYKNQNYVLCYVIIT